MTYILKGRGAIFLLFTLVHRRRSRYVGGGDQETRRGPTETAEVHRRGPEFQL